MSYKPITQYQKSIENPSGTIDIGGVDGHESIYKYVSLDTKTSWNYLEDTFEKSKLIGATINSLNDPFEGKCEFFDDLSKVKIEDCCNYWSKSGQEADCWDKYKNKSPQQISDMVEKLTEKSLSDSRIISFCRRSDSPLLWSHYANSHKGACLHFVANAFRGEGVYKGSVRYMQNRPSVPLSLPARIVLPDAKDQDPREVRKYRAELLSAALFRKPVDWAYEEEVRVCYTVEKMTNLEFDSSGLFSIIFGARCPQEDRDRILKIVHGSGCKLRFREAYISDTTFAVDIRDVPI